MSKRRAYQRLLTSIVLATFLVAPTAAADGAPPAPPANLQGQAQPDGTYLLSWQAPAQGDVDGYRVYEDGDLLAEVAGLSHDVADGALAAVYTVTSFNEFGESQHSNPVVRTPINQGPACVMLSLPPLVQPSACVMIVDEAIGWIKNLVCSAPCPIVNTPRIDSLVDTGP